MYKVAVLIWIMLGTTLAGMGVVVVLSTPQLESQAASLLPIIAAAGFIVAVPLSVMIAKQLYAAVKPAS